jgi:hypothetical protein
MLRRWPRKVTLNDTAEMCSGFLREVKYFVISVLSEARKPGSLPLALTERAVGAPSA